MRHTKIAAIATTAAFHAAGIETAGGIEVPSMLLLYGYARERKFPPAETLARKHAGISGDTFPFASLAAAPEPVRALYTVFAAVAQALEPFHEEDTVTPTEKPDDSIEARTRAAQAEMDAEIAKHQFGDSPAATPPAAPDTPKQQPAKPAKKKRK
jgi:hypothetical protein